MHNEISPFWKLKKKVLIIFNKKKIINRNKYLQFISIPKIITCTNCPKIKNKKKLFILVEREVYIPHSIKINPQKETYYQV